VGFFKQNTGALSNYKKTKIQAGRQALATRQRAPPAPTST